MSTEIQKLLIHTGLRNDYIRMSTLDTRIQDTFEELMKYADYHEAGEEHPYILKGIQNATGKARYHFNHSDPDQAATLACAEYHKTLCMALDDVKKISHGK